MDHQIREVFREDLSLSFRNWRLHLRRNLLEVLVSTVVVGLLAAGAYSRNKVWSDEISFWTDIVRKSPRKARGYANLGYAYLMSADYDRAMDWSQKAIQLDPGLAVAYHNLSLIYQKRGDLNQAIETGEKVVALDTNLSMGYHSLGGIYFENKQYDKAEACYKTFIKEFPYYPEAHNLLALTYAAQRRFDKAVEALEGELRVNPFHTLAHVNLGQIYWFELRNREKAIRHLKAALLVDPLFPDRAKVRKLIQAIEESSP
jgi:tetratricopeptide (TPR) repeat protein